MATDVLRIYIDTNALIAALEGEGTIATLVQQVLAESATDRVTFVTSQLTLGELLVGPLRDEDPVRSNAILALFAGEGPLEIAEIDRAIVIAAADLKAVYRRLKWPDAVHLATALGKECSHVLSNDHGLPKLPGLTFIRLQEAALQTMLAEIRHAD